VELGWYGLKLLFIIHLGTGAPECAEASSTPAIGANRACPGPRGSSFATDRTHAIPDKYRAELDISGITVFHANSLMGSLGAETPRPTVTHPGATGAK
jgi:hypothetical protein